MGLNYKVVKKPRMARQSQSEKEMGKPVPEPSALPRRELRDRKSMHAPTTIPTTTATTTAKLNHQRKRLRIRSPSPPPQPPPIPRRRASLKASTLIKKDAERQRTQSRLFQSRVTDGDVPATEDGDEGEEMGDTIVVAAPRLMLMLRAKQRASGRGGPRPAVIERREESSDSSSSDEEVVHRTPTALQPTKRRRIVVLRPPMREKSSPATVADPVVEDLQAAPSQPPTQEQEQEQEQTHPQTPDSTLKTPSVQDKYTPPPTPPVKEATLSPSSSSASAEGEEARLHVGPGWGCPSPPAEAEAPWLEEGTLNEEPGFFMEAFGDVTGGMEVDGGLKRRKGAEEEGCSEKGAKRQKVGGEESETSPAGVVGVKEAVDGELAAAVEAAERVAEGEVGAGGEEGDEDEVDLVKVPESTTPELLAPTVEEVAADNMQSTEGGVDAVAEVQRHKTEENDIKDVGQEAQSAVPDAAPPGPLALHADKNPEAITRDDQDNGLPNAAEPVDAGMDDTSEPTEETTLSLPTSTATTPEPEPIKPFSALTKATTSSQPPSPSPSPVQPFFHPLARDPEAIDLTMTDDSPSRPLAGPPKDSVDDLAMTDASPLTHTTLTMSTLIPATPTSPSPTTTTPLHPTPRRQSYDAILSQLTPPAPQTTEKERRPSLPTTQTPSTPTYHKHTLPYSPSLTQTYQSLKPLRPPTDSGTPQAEASTKGRCSPVGQEGRLALAVREPLSANPPTTITTTASLPSAPPTTQIPTPQQQQQPPPTPSTPPKRKRGRPPKPRLAQPAPFTHPTPPIPILPHTLPPNPSRVTRPSASPPPSRLSPCPSLIQPQPSPPLTRPNLGLPHFAVTPPVRYLPFSLAPGRGGGWSGSAASAVVAGGEGRGVGGMGPPPVPVGEALRREKGVGQVVPPVRTVDVMGRERISVASLLNG